MKLLFEMSEYFLYLSFTMLCSFLADLTFSAAVFSQTYLILRECFFTYS